MTDLVQRKNRKNSQYAPQHLSPFVLYFVAFLMTAGEAIAEQGYMQINGAARGWVWTYPVQGCEGLGGISRTMQGIIGYGEGGTLLTRTTNNGRSWEQFPVLDANNHPFGVNTDNLQFINDAVGFTLSPVDTIVYKTTDGGMRWFSYIRLNSVLADSLSFMFLQTPPAFKMLNERVGVMLVQSGDQLRRYAFLTKDGGFSWRQVLRGTFFDMPCFIDSLHGWASGFLAHQSGGNGDSGVYLRTNNGGLSWDTVICGIQNSGSPDDIVWNHLAQFCDTMRGVDVAPWYKPVYGQYLEFTTDGGSHWQQFHSKLDPLDPYFPLFWKYDSTGMFIGLSSHHNSSGTILVYGHTKDFGAHWVRDSSVFGFDPGIGVLDIFDTLTAGSFDGMFTTDGGKNWQPKDSLGRLRMQNMFFVDRDHGYLIITESQLNTWLLQTDDGGRHWKPRYDVPGDSLVGLFDYSAMRNSKVVTAGSSTGCYLSADKGKTFKSISALPSTTGYYTQFSFVDSIVGWAFSSRRGIWRTTDGGTSWTSQQDEIVCESPDCNYYGHSFMIDRRVGWLIQFRLDNEDAAGIYKTTNGGVSWDTVPFIDSIDLSINGIYFLDTLHGFIYGIGSSVETMDGGNTWHESPVGWTGTMNFQDSLLGFTNNKRTTDGGKTWTNAGCEALLTWWPDTSTAIFANDINMCNSTVGHYGPFDATASAVEQKVDAIVPNDLHLTNYPNPFSEATTIAFSFPGSVDAQTLQLVVFNMLGEQVLDLSVDSRHLGKSGEISIQTPQLPMGVYFAQLRAGSSIQMQRLVVAR